MQNSKCKIQKLRTQALGRVKWVALALPARLRSHNGGQRALLGLEACLRVIAGGEGTYQTGAMTRSPQGQSKRSAGREEKHVGLAVGVDVSEGVRQFTDASDHPPRGSTIQVDEVGKGAFQLRIEGGGVVAGRP